MESEGTKTTSDGVNNGYQKMQLPHGRTSGPTRRSTTGKWTAEEDETLRKAVQHFKGKNWKKIAECFKDRTDVQCLHRWQKVLDPELVKGPWSKEEDEIIVELVKKYGAKKWSTIAQNLPGRIGKQCRERWHNHLNPNINKDAWTQEEELALIRAHQIYGNKWAELTKFLPGRSDNAIKNHWNSSVKKKLDSYLASGLLAQFQGPPHAGHPNESLLLSSSRVKQSSGDDIVLKDETEVEEVSECSQGSALVGCSQSTSDVGNAQIVHTREEVASSSENYHTASENVAFSVPEVPFELGGPKLFEHNLSYDLENSDGRDWPLNSNDSPDLSLVDLGHESTGFFSHFNENHEGVPFPSKNSVGLSDTYEENTSGSDRLHMSISEKWADGSFLYGNLMNCSNFYELDESTDSLLLQSINYQIPETEGSLASQSFYPVRSDVLGTSCSQSFSVPTTSGSDPNQFNDLSLGNQEDQLVTSSQDGYVYTNDSISNDGTRTVSPLYQGKDCIQLVSAAASGESNEIPTSPSMNENAGSLFYEPPRFPRLDIPFFSCDLIQSGSDTHLEYSPLGIRQLLMSSMDSLTPFRLWDSPARDGSPDALLKSAAKTFTCTPSILKKRNRDMFSPLSEKRGEKKLEGDKNRESFLISTREFSGLDVFDKNGSQISPPSNQKRNSRVSDEDKENLGLTVAVDKEEGNDGTALLEKESDSSSPLLDNTKKVTAGTGVIPKADVDVAAAQFCQVRQSSGVLVEHNMKDPVYFSPDRFGIKSERDMNTRTVGNQQRKRLEEASNQSALLGSSSENPCLSSVLSPTIGGKKVEKDMVPVASVQSAPSSAPMEILVESYATDAGVENLSMFSETPFKRSIESPSAWKSPWFINSFLPGPRVDTDISIEDIGYYTSPGERSYDAIGLMKQLSEHTAAAFADAQEVLGNETPQTILKERQFNNQKQDREKNHVAPSQPETHSPVVSNVLTERRVLDFSECGTPVKGTGSGKFSSAVSFSSPSSYLLKNCR